MKVLTKASENALSEMREVKLSVEKTNSSFLKAVETTNQTLNDETLDIRKYANELQSRISQIKVDVEN